MSPDRPLVPGLSASPATGGPQERMTQPETVDLEDWVAQVYELAVRNPAITRARLIAAAIPARIIDVVIRELLSRGLLRAGGAPESWEATPPEIALPAMAARLEHQAARARAATGDLARVYHDVRAQESPGTDHQVERLRSQQELHNAMSVVISTAQRELLSMRDTSPRTAFEFTRDLSDHRERLVGPDGTLVRARATYDTRTLQLPRAGDVLRARADAGEEVRFLGNIPFSVLVADDTTALLDLTSYDSSGTGSLLIRDRRLVLALRALVDNTWHLGTPMAGARHPQLEDRSALIVSLLAAGATDTVIAAQANVSQRTVERTVRSLMEQLGAATRFQAGVQAVRRGWLPSSDVGEGRTDAVATQRAPGEGTGQGGPGR